MMLYAGPNEVDRYVAITLKHGLKLYLNTGMKPNSRWTLTNMLKMAGKFTGKTYKRSQGWQALADLTALLEG